MQTFAMAAIALVGAAMATEPYHSGALKTVETFQYGRFGTEFKASGKKGTVSSFFTYWEGDEHHPWSKAGWNELDVEIVPSMDDPYSTNIIYAGQKKDHAYIKNADAATGWHTYWVEWTPEYIAWWYDGEEVRHVEGEASQRDIKKFSNLRMDFWTPEAAGWGDDFNDKAMPWYTQYKWVEVQDYDHATK